MKRCDHTYANKEDHVETRDDDKTKVVMSTDDHNLKQSLQSNQYDSLEQEQYVQTKCICYNMKPYWKPHLSLYVINYCFGSINIIDYDNMKQEPYAQ